MFRCCLTTMHGVVTKDYHLHIVKIVLKVCPNNAKHIQHFDNGAFVVVLVVLLTILLNQLSVFLVMC